MAARQGFEPRQNGPKPFVLPLHHRAVKNIGCYTKDKWTKGQAFVFKKLIESAMDLLLVSLIVEK